MKNELIQLTRELISIPSDVSTTCNENEIANFIYKYLEKLNIFKLEKQEVENNRYNIIAIKGNPKTFLMGHMDTVPRQNKDKDSFEGKMIGNKLYGLGSVDMKAGLAIMLKLAQESVEDIGLIFTVDEEYEFKGTFKLIEGFKLNPELIINIEPTNLEIVNGYRGIAELELEIEGKTAHASRKYLGINAIEKSIELANLLEEKLNKINSFAKTSANLAYLKGGSLSNGEIKSVGNFVPNYSKIKLEIRLGSRAITQNMIKNYISDIASLLDIRIQNLTFNFLLGSMYTDPKSLKKFEKVLVSQKLDLKYKDINSTGFFEVQMLQEKWNCKTLVFGPGPSDMAHNKNEFVKIDSIFKTFRILSLYLSIH